MKLCAVGMRNVLLGNDLKSNIYLPNGKGDLHFFSFNEEYIELQLEITVKILYTMQISYTAQTVQILYTVQTLGGDASL